MNRTTQLQTALRDGTIKAVIFDFDGTLVNIMPPLRRAVAEVFDKHSIYDGTMEKTLEEIGVIMEAVQGTPMTKIILQAYDIFQFVTVLEEYRVIKKLRVATEIFSKFQKIQHTAPFFPGAVDLVKALAEEFELFIVSHSKTDPILEQLTQAGIQDCFTGIYGADAIPAMKPDPAALTPVLVEMENLNPDQFVMIGDMPTDLEVAQAAGMWTVAVTYGVGKSTVLEDCEPDTMVDSLGDIMTWVENITQAKAQDKSKIPSQAPIRLES